jgi:hypothetical protein
MPRPRPSGDQDREIIRDPARSLDASVILQALADAGVVRAVNSAQPGVAEVASAQYFLTDATGPYAQSRETWCDVAGIDATALRRHVLASPPWRL